MSKINILVNGENFSIEKDSKISDLIKNLDLDIAKVAVEKNLEIVDAGRFELSQINEGDKIEIVHFIGGG